MFNTLRKFFVIIYIILIHFSDGYAVLRGYYRVHLYHSNLFLTTQIFCRHLYHSNSFLTLESCQFGHRGRNVLIGPLALVIPVKESGFVFTGVVGNISP